MYKSLKALALLVAMAPAISAIADNSPEVQPGPVIGTIGGPVTQETVTPKDESKLQRLYNFVSKHKGDIVLGALSVLALSLGAYAMYDLFYIKVPASKIASAEAQELNRQTKVVTEIFKKLSETTKDLSNNQQA